MLAMLAVLAGAGLAALGLGFAIFVGQIEARAPAEVEHAEGMVVLTGGADRVPDAIELFSHGYADRLLITGVNQAISKAEIANLNPRYRKLIDCCVDLGYEALNTTGNAEETRQWAERNEIRRSIIVVTSNYHLPRAMAELRHVLPEVELRAYPVVTLKMRDARWWRSPHAARVLGAEFVKYVVAILRLRAGAWVA
jgi:uncharacterized SAM-binding protein YcdF (DUF218 family)